MQCYCRTSTARAISHVAAEVEGRPGMKKIALFLGAGASVPYGMPTTKGLMEKLESNFPRQDLLDKYPDIEHVVQILDQEVRIADTKAGKHHCGINEALNKNLGKTIRAKKTIEKLIRRHYHWETTRILAVEKILDPLFRLVMSDEKHVTIFTTNYDTVIERYTAGAKRGIDLINGFKPHPAAHAYVWKGSFTANNDMPIKAYLYKLHRSLNWQETEVGGEWLIAERPDEGASGIANRNMYIRPSLNIKKEARRVEPYATMYKKFAKLLGSFDVCIVIGCSFRDKPIRRKFLEFIQLGGILIAISPTASADFLTALDPSYPPKEAAKWGEKPLCSMSYLPGGKQGFYAVHQKLGEDDTDAMIDTVNRIIAGKASPHVLGSIVLEEP